MHKNWQIATLSKKGSVANGKQTIRSNRHRMGTYNKYIPEKEPGTPGRPPKPHRPIINGIVWIARSGAPWRDMPERYGPWETAYTRFRELVDSGILVKMFGDLNIDADMQDLSPDSTIVKAHQHSAGAKKGANQPKLDVPVED
jgi:transposase